MDGDMVVWQLVSIHAPRVGGDAGKKAFEYGEKMFQSTPPAWGATIPRRWRRSALPVSIHAPRVGGDGAWRNFFHALEIYCHNCGPRCSSSQKRRLLDRFRSKLMRS